MVFLLFLTLMENTVFFPTFLITTNGIEQSGVDKIPIKSCSANLQLFSDNSFLSSCVPAHEIDIAVVGGYGVPAGHLCTVGEVAAVPERGAEGAPLADELCDYVHF